MFCGYPVEDTSVDRMNKVVIPVPLKVRTKITQRQMIMFLNMLQVLNGF